MPKNRLLIPAIRLTAIFTLAANAFASVQPCNQSLIDQLPPTTTSYIYPRVPLQPIWQWQNNDGYCGEVSLIQSGLSNGQWMSEYDMRLVCGGYVLQNYTLTNGSKSITNVAGSPLGQTGAPATNSNYCAANKTTPDYNAELLMELPNTGVAGTTELWDSIGICAQNARLAGTSYNYVGVAGSINNSVNTQQTAATSLGYQGYMSWVKQQVIAGNQVTVTILIRGYAATSGDQYDHIVSVQKIGTNHSPTDPTYYADDVLYFEDHGNYWYNGKKATQSSAPATPPGAGSDSTECTPYFFGYTFGSLGQTDANATAKTNPNVYSIVLPANQQILTQTGANGGEAGTIANGSAVTITGPNNYGFAVSGPLDTYGETVPVALSASGQNQPGAIIGPTTTNGVANPLDPIAGYDYENPFIATGTSESGCSNYPPGETAPGPGIWMDNFVLQPTVSGLTPGVAYNLYEYQFNSPTATDSLGNGTAAALKVPITAFNGNAAMATAVTPFVANQETYLGAELVTTSDQIVVYRAVPAAPGLYSPAPNSTLTGTSLPFAWDKSTEGPAAGATAYKLSVGKEPGGTEYYHTLTAFLPSTTFFENVTNLPKDGSTVWARWSYLVGGVWKYTDYSYTAE